MYYQSYPRPRTWITCLTLTFIVSFLTLEQNILQKSEFWLCNIQIFCYCLVVIRLIFVNSTFSQGFFVITSSIISLPLVSITTGVLYYEKTTCRSIQKYLTYNIQCSRSYTLKKAPINQMIRCQTTHWKIVLVSPNKFPQNIPPKNSKLLYILCGHTAPHSKRHNFRYFY